MAWLATQATHRLQTMAEAADLNLPPARLWQGLAAIALLGAGYGALQAGLVGALLGAVVLEATAVAALWGNRHRRDQKIEAQLPGFLEAIARGLRTGLQLGPATVEAAATSPAPLATEVAPLATDLQQGLRNSDVFERWARRRPEGGTQLAAAAISFAASAGGARARAIDAVATTLRDRIALEAETRSLTSQAKASAWLIALLPVGFLTVSASAGERAGSFLFTTRIGLIILLLGLGLDAIGAFWMRRIVCTGA